MEKLNIGYEGYKIEFKIPEEIYSNKELYIEAKKLFKNKHFWFEVVLFELIDVDEDGVPDKEYGREFVIELGEYPLKTNMQRIISKGSTRIGDKVFPSITYIKK